MDTCRLFVGYDSREALAYHVFCESVIEHASIPVAFYPIHKGLLGKFDGQRDGSNRFVFSRYLVPWLCDYIGWAIFMDGDMVCTRDMAELWAYRDIVFDRAVSVVKHDYKTRSPRKYVGSQLESDNVDYPRKNWSSVILWNCSHYGNRGLDPDMVAKLPAEEIHRFGWLRDSQIGSIPADWNHLVGEDSPGPAALFHYTLGVPALRHYADCHASWTWHSAYLRAMECAGESASAIAVRAEGRIGAIE